MNKKKGTNLPPWRFNIAPSNLDIHDPSNCEGGIMASRIEKILKMFLKGDLLTLSGFSKKTQDIGVGGITVIIHMN